MFGLAAHGNGDRKGHSGAGRAVHLIAGQTLPRGGDVERRQIRTAEGRAGRLRHVERNFIYKISVRIVTTDTGASPFRAPETALGIHRRAVGG